MDLTGRNGVKHPFQQKQLMRSSWTVNSEGISALEKEILKYSSEMAKGLVDNKVDKS